MSNRLRTQTVAGGDYPDDKPHSIPKSLKRRSLVDPGYSTESVLDLPRIQSGIPDA